MTTSDWTEILKRGRWLFRRAAELGKREPRLAAEWGRAIRLLSQSFNWDVAKRVGAFALEVSQDSTEFASELLSELPHQMAMVPQGRLEEFLEQVEAFAAESPELAVVASRALPEAMRKLDGQAFLEWCDSVRVRGLPAEQVAAHLRGESEVGRARMEMAEPGLSLASVRPHLLHYVQAHVGRHLPIQAVPVSDGLGFSCDGHRVFLPARLCEFGDARDALSYRVRAAMAAGFVEFGSFDLDLEKLALSSDGEASEGDLEGLCGQFRFPFTIRCLFERFERVRVEQALRHTYPGLSRDLDLWKAGLVEKRGQAGPSGNPIDGILEDMERIWLGADGVHPKAQAWMKAANSRLGHGVPVEETARLVLETAPHLMDLFDDNSAEPGPVPRSLDLALEERRSSEQAMDRRLREIRSELRQADIESPIEGIRAALERRSDGPGEAYSEVLDFLRRNPPPDGGLVDEVAPRDVGDSASHLSPIGDALQPEGGVLYREWDEEIQDYRPSWVRVVERPLQGGDAGFAQRTQAEHGRHIEALRRRFEALRPENFRRVRAQVHGDELDLDRVVEAWVETRSGRAPGERIYSQTRRLERSVAVALLVDLSSSTNEPARFGGKRIIDVEKEALMVTAEALQALGDPFAIYGFSGFSREEVAFFTAKEFGAAYDAQVRARIGGLGFQMENRDGAAIRHAGEKLLAQPAKTRVLFLVSDGKPLDCGCPKYQDAYAQADTRMALIELRAKGIKAFCITVDPKGADYLSDVYGGGNYTVVDDVERLPVQLPQFYQRIAT